MLKIKDNVDLKELEKFGFFREANNYKDYYKKTKFAFFEKEWITIDIKTREITCCSRKLLSTLYDLIKADLVEKVEE